MFFMPDIVLVQDGSRVGAVNYSDLNVRWQDSRFIETERVPSDAKVVDHTWAHPNKSGGPDRRFKNNRQIPICLYEAMHFTSNNGVNELVEFSRTGVATAFVDGCRMLGALPRGRTTLALPLASVNDDRNVAPPPLPASEKKRSVLKVVMLSIFGILFGIPILAMIIGFDDKKADTSLPPALLVEIADTVTAVENGAPLSNVKVGTKQQVLEAPATSIVVPTASKPNKHVQLEPAVEQQRTEALRYTQTAVNLREGPGTKFRVMTVVQKGGEVSVLEDKGGWSRFLVNENIFGWMASSTIAKR